MSEYKTKILLGAVLAVLLATGLAVAAISLAPQLGLQTSTQQQQQTTAISGAQSMLLIQLTDPPTVPDGTSSLNLTYSAINLLVGEPSGQSGQVTPKIVTVTPQGGSATVDLLKLQNISQTLATANLPAGSTIYSVSFTVSSISIDINDKVSPVTLATGGSTLLVTLVSPTMLQGTNAVLLDLHPTIVNATTGYQMIPSSIGVIKPQSEINGQDNGIGSKHQLTDQDHHELDQANGQVTAKLLALSASGSTTTVAIELNNTGAAPVQLVAIGINGNFTSAQGSTSCPDSNQGDQGQQGNSNHHDGGYNQMKHQDCGMQNEIVFVPVVPTSTTSSTTTTSASTTSSSSTSTQSCTTGLMTPAHYGDGQNDENNAQQLVLTPGECLILAFSGTISYGQSSTALVPSTNAGQMYLIHVIASNGAEMKLSCTLPVSSTSCTAMGN